MNTEYHPYMPVPGPSYNSETSDMQALMNDEHDPYMPILDPSYYSEGGSICYENLEETFTDSWAKKYDPHVHIYPDNLCEDLNTSSFDKDDSFVTDILKMIDTDDDNHNDCYASSVDELSFSSLC